MLNVRGLADHSRLTLFTFMLALISFNPIGLVVDRMAPDRTDYTSSSDGSRTILGHEGSAKK